MKHPGDKEGRRYLLQNRTSYAGMYLAGVGLVILFIAVIDWMQGGHSSYGWGLLLLLSRDGRIGGMLILFGAWRKRRRAGAEAVPERMAPDLTTRGPAGIISPFVGGAVLRASSSSSPPGTGARKQFFSWPSATP